MQRREFEGNTSAKGADISADNEFENKFRYRKHRKQGWEKMTFSGTLWSFMKLHHNRVESTVISE